MKVLRWLFRVSAPILILEYFVLYFVARNLHERLTAWDVVPPMIIAAVLGALLIGVFRLFMKSLDRAVLAAAAWAVFIFYVPIYEAFVYEMQWPFRHRYLLPLFGIIMIGVPILARRLREEMLRTVHRVATYVSMVLVALTLYPIAARAMTEAKARLTNEQVIEFVYPEGESPYEIAIDTTKKPLGYYPDIYYIIPDGYARHDVLQDVYGFDNSEFLTYLEEKGFYVAYDSRSNYDVTIYSIPSTLEMTYFTNEYFVSDHRQKPRYSRKHRIVETLKSIDYKVYQYVNESLFENSDIVDTPRQVYFTRIHRMLLHKTVLQSLGKANSLASFLSRIDDRSAVYRRWLRNSFQIAVETPETDRPKFVLLHSWITHPRFLFSSDGGETRESLNTRKQYIDTIIYVNFLMRNAIDILIDRYRNIDRELIIVIQADHGPRTPYFDDNARASTDWSDTSLTLRDRVGILNAYYLPGRGEDKLYQSITPVNTFRVILNEYLGANIDLLEDISYCKRNYYLDIDARKDFGPFVEIRGDSAVFYTEGREAKSVFHFPKKDSVETSIN